MSKVLRKGQYNNGYGCSCCRNDWEESHWIDETKMIPFEFLLAETIKEFDKNCDDGGIVGLSYMKDGELLYGISANIYTVDREFYAVFGDEEFLIKGYEGVCRDRSYSVEEILEEYEKTKTTERAR